MGKIFDDVSLITKEIVKSNNQNFTGKMIVTLDMNQGGIARISINKDQILKNSSKRP